MRLAAIAGSWWLFAGACVITKRWTALHRDQAARLHRDSLRRVILKIFGFHKYIEA